MLAFKGQITEAIAQAWNTKENEHKTFDQALVEAIVKNLYEWLDETTRLVNYDKAIEGILEIKQFVREVREERK